MDNIREVDKNTIVNEGKKLLDAGGKFVTSVCNDVDPDLEVTYFFSTERGTVMTGLRYTVPKDVEVPSLSGITLATVLIENEMKELFGLKVKGIAIDYNGNMLLAHDSPITPMLKEKKAEPKGEKN